MDRNGNVILPKAGRKQHGQVYPLLVVSVIHSINIESIVLDSCYLYQKNIYWNPLKQRTHFLDCQQNMCLTNRFPKHGHS